MSRAWFIKKGDLIDGPLGTTDVQTRIQTGQLEDKDLIWGRGMETWYTPATWLAELAQLITNTRQTPVTETWHYAAGGQSYGPLLRDALIQKLKHLDNHGVIMLWTKGMKEWAPLFEFHDILTEIGINKRQFPRADISGKAVLKTASSTLVAPLVSISEGGFGIQLDSGIVSGEVVTVELQSPSIREVIHAKAEVRYAGGSVVGMKFTQLSVESRGAIIQYVRQSQVRFTLRTAA
jgi:hypothetical protein